MWESGSKNTRKMIVSERKCVRERVREKEGVKRERVFIFMIEFIWDRKRKCVRDGVEIWESEGKTEKE